MMKGIIGSQMKEKPQANIEVLTKALYGVKAMLYKDGLIERLADMIGKKRDAAATISDAVAAMVGEVKKKYSDIDDQALFVFSVYTVAEIVRTLKQAGMIEDSAAVSQDAIGGVVMKYIQDNPDSIDPTQYAGESVSPEMLSRGERVMSGVSL